MAGCHFGQKSTPNVALHPFRCISINATSSTGPKSKQALKFIENEGKKNGQMNFKSKGSLHGQNSSHLQGCLSSGCGVKIPIAIPIPDLLRQTLGQLVSLVTIALQSPTLNTIKGSGNQ